MLFKQTMLNGLGKRFERRNMEMRGGLSP